MGALLSKQELASVTSVEFTEDGSHVIAAGKNLFKVRYRVVIRLKCRHRANFSKNKLQLQPSGSRSLLLSRWVQQQQYLQARAKV